MYAVRCHAYGPPEDLVYEQTDAPTASPGQVVIDVRAAGVNFPDLLIVQGKYQFQPPPPFSPGGEVAGVVAEVGEGVEGIAVGDRVIGLGAWGGFAERMAVPAMAVLPAPEALDWPEAAAFTLTFATALYALRDRAAVKPGETVLILGAAGGVGMASIEVAKALGANVIAAASTAEKLERCREAGADQVIDYATEDLKKRTKALTGGQGANVVIDSVGGPFSEPALRATAWGGRFCVIGFAAGDIPSVPLNLPLLKGCSVVGVFWGSAIVREPGLAEGHVAQLAAWVAEGRIGPRVWKTYPLAQAAQALDDIANRRVIGKVVLVP